MIRRYRGWAWCLMLLFLALLLFGCQSYSQANFTTLAAVELEQGEVSADRCAALDRGAGYLRNGGDKRWRGPYGTGQAMEATAFKFDRQAINCGLLVNTDDQVSRQRALNAWKKLWRTGLKSVGGGSS